ncbi:hypothetical protein BH18ACI1_BH18ACI1_14220 [soil metagenome]
MKEQTIMGTKQEEANLIVRLYEIRRDAEFRKAREWFDTEFNPQSAQEIIDLFGSGFAPTAYFRMVLTYWEMVAALVNYGSIDAGLIHTTNVEHLRYWAKIKPFMAEVRKAMGGEFLPELEKLVKTAPDYEKRLAGWRELNKNWAEKA